MNQQKKGRKIQMGKNEVVQPEGNYYDKYHSKNIIEKFMMKNFFLKISKIISGGGSPNSILEAGCGEGNVLHFINGLFPDAELKGFDFSKKAINRAILDFPQLNFEIGNIYEIDDVNSQYDLVIACEVLEHLEEPEKALEELIRVSSKYILLSVPSEPLWRILNMARGKYIKNLGNTPGHIQHWNRRKFKKWILSKPGICIKNIELPIPWIVVLVEKI